MNGASLELEVRSYHSEAFYLIQNILNIVIRITIIGIFRLKWIMAEAEVEL